MGTLWEVATPIWWVCLLLAIRPAVRLAGALGARRRKGQCEGCGYDLRASNDRCPECGQAAPKGRRKAPEKAP
jgi:predicted amidophosphoribosyltransferase